MYPEHEFIRIFISRLNISPDHEAPRTSIQDEYLSTSPDHEAPTHILAWVLSILVTKHGRQC